MTCYIREIQAKRSFSIYFDRGTECRYWFAVSQNHELWIYVFATFCS